MELTTPQVEAVERLRGLDGARADSQDFLDTVVLIAKTFFLPLRVECGITLHTNGQLVSVAQTVPVLEIIEEAQNPDEGGPVFNSLERGTTTVVDETLEDQRWPAYLKTIADHGYHSILSMCLVTTGRSKATINFYAQPPRSFTPALRTAGEHFAAESAQRLRNLLRGSTP